MPFLAQLHGLLEGGSSAAYGCLLQFLCFLGWEFLQRGSDQKGAALRGSLLFSEAPITKGTRYEAPVLPPGAFASNMH